MWINWFCYKSQPPWWSWSSLCLYLISVLLGVCDCDPYRHKHAEASSSYTSLDNVEFLVQDSFKIKFSFLWKYKINTETITDQNGSSEFFPSRRPIQTRKKSTTDTPCILYIGFSKENQHQQWFVLPVFDLYVNGIVQHGLWCLPQA